MKHLPETPATPAAAGGPEVPHSPFPACLPLHALTEAGCGPVFSGKINTRIKVRSEFVKAVGFAHTTEKAVPHQRDIFTMHEMKRLGAAAPSFWSSPRTYALELLADPLSGVYAPSGHSAAPFAFFADTAEPEREYVREKPLESQAAARERGRHSGRPKVIVDDTAAYARSLRASTRTPVTLL